MGLVMDWPDAGAARRLTDEPIETLARQPERGRRPVDVSSTARQDRSAPPRLVYATVARWISSIGDGLIFVAFPLLATRLTHSPVLIAGVAFATSLPWLVLGVPAGALVDRVSRRTLLTGVELARMVVLLLLGAAIASHHLVLAEVYLAAFLITAFETLFDAATMAVVPQLVRGGDLVRANSRLQVAQLSGEQFIGPALGGVAFAIAASLPVLVDGASFAASAALLVLALRPARRIGRHARSRRDDDFELDEPVALPDRPSFLRQLREGLTWLVREPRLRLVCGLIATFAFCQGLGLGIVVIYCTRVLHLGGTGFGLFTAAAASGNTIGAWAAPRVHAWLGAGRTLLVAGLVGGAAFLLLAATSTTAIAVAALCAEAVAVGVGMVVSIALRQRLIPLELAGRVSAAMRSTIMGAGAIATILGGGLVVLAGAHAPFAIGGAAQIVAALLIGGALVRQLAAGEPGVIDLTEVVDLTVAPSAIEQA